MSPWAYSIINSHTTVREMIPIVIACALSGHLRWGSTVLAQCDNIAVLHLVNHGSYKNQEVMNLGRCLAFISAKFDFHIVVTHTKGVQTYGQMRFLMIVSRFSTLYVLRPIRKKPQFPNLC